MYVCISFGSQTSRVQNRGAEIMSTLKASSAMSCAVAIEKHLQDWLGVGAPAADRGEGLFSLGILSDGNPYSVPEGLVFSFPCRRSVSGKIEIVPGLSIDEHTRALIDKTTVELTEERAAAKDFL